MKTKDIKYVFEQNPELENIGTKTQYYKYLKTIFPESRVKDIVYHGTSNKFEKEEFDLSKLGSSTNNITNKLGFYFVPEEKVAEIFIKGKKYKWEEGKIKKVLPLNSKIYANLINLKNPETIEGDIFKKYAEENKSLPPLKLNGDSLIITPQTENILPEFSVNNYVIFNSNQVHILGSQKDLEGFKQFVKENPKDSLEKKVLSGIFAFFIFAGLFLTSFNLTGNVVTNSYNDFNFYSISLFLIGILGFYINRKYKK